MMWLIQLYMYETDHHYAYLTENLLCWLYLSSDMSDKWLLLLCVW